MPTTAPCDAHGSSCLNQAEFSEGTNPMPIPIDSNSTRRGTLVGLTAIGFGLVARPVLAGDRPMISTGRATECINDGVRISEVSGRIATASDFSGSGSCRMSRGTVEGPYFICADSLNARNISDGLEGTRMALALRVTDQSCTPISGAIVDVWQCDARGNYSGYSASPDEPAGGTRGQRQDPDTPVRFLRGVLATDVEGIVEFDAIYPGFYHGRAIHTHFKVHVGGKSYLTSQALYPEEWNEKILANPLYSEGRGTDRVRNEHDFIARSGVLFTVSERSNRLLATINLSILA